MPKLKGKKEAPKNKGKTSSPSPKPAKQPQPQPEEQIIDNEMMGGQDPSMGQQDPLAGQSDPSMMQQQDPMMNPAMMGPPVQPSILDTVEMLNLPYHTDDGFPTPSQGELRFNSHQRSGTPFSGRVPKPEWWKESSVYRFMGGQKKTLEQINDELVMESRRCDTNEKR